MKNIGIQINSDYDLEIKVRRGADNRIMGGLQIDDITYQNQALILKAHKGEFKEYPTVGIGIENALNDSDFRLWRREITEQLEADGQQVERLVLNEREFILNAKYK